MTLVKLDTNLINDWNTFHDVFAKAFGFFDGYGHNMDAWIDCMTRLDEPPGLSTVLVIPGEIVALELDHMDELARRCAEQYSAIIECSAFVNWRRIQLGQPPILALSFYKSAP